MESNRETEKKYEKGQQALCIWWDMKEESEVKVFHVANLRLPEGWF